MEKIKCTIERITFQNPENGYSVLQATINGHIMEVLPLAHPRQIGALGAHSEMWNKLHLGWESKK